MRKSLSWRVSRQLRYNHMIKYLKLATLRGWLFLASVEPGASVTGTNLLENQHAYTKTGFAPTPQNKHIHCEPRDYRHQLANLIKFYQLACVNMAARHIYSAIFAVSLEFYPPMVWPLCIRLVSAAHTAAVPDGSINKSSPASICRRSTSNSRRHHHGENS